MDIYPYMFVFVCVCVSKNIVRKNECKNGIVATLILKRRQEVVEFERDLK